MSTDIRQAFEHPEARAAATARSDAPADRISLRDHIVEVEIGAFQAERGTTQRICFNIVVEVTPPAAPLDDDVDRILSYDTITEAIAAELAAERLNLLETLAERIADRVLAEPQALRVFVRIEKLDRGPGALGVEIVRARGQTPPSQTKPATDQAAPHPLVVYLTNAAIAADSLGAWLDLLESDPRAVILCVGPGDTSAPQAAAALAQRRIDLLAIEQNAWVLAGRDRRCVVVGSRTELDWAMKHGQISVWAPSKVVLDAVDGPSAETGDAIALSAWFANVIEAQALVVIGGPAPQTGAIPAISAAIGSPTLPSQI